MALFDCILDYKNSSHSSSRFWIPYFWEKTVEEEKLVNVTPMIFPYHVRRPSYLWGMSRVPNSLQFVYITYTKVTRAVKGTKTKARKMGRSNTEIFTILKVFAGY